MTNNLVYSLILTSVAGLSTMIGALIIFLVRTTCTKHLSFGLGLSAGIMIYLSFFELLKESNKLLKSDFNNNYSGSVILIFLCGLMIAWVIDTLTHKGMGTCHNLSCKNLNPNNYQQNIFNQQNLLKTGIFTAIIIGIHNFPEGIATFTIASFDLIFGVSMATAIAIHNIPEGFCIALPIYYATHSKKTSFLYALIAGLAEPLGALLTYLILFPHISNNIIGIMLAIVAGFMVYISFDELLPSARKYGGHISLLGLICGMGLMAISLRLLN